MQTFSQTAAALAARQGLLPVLTNQRNPRPSEKRAIRIILREAARRERRGK